MRPVIQVEHLSKHYRLGLIGGGTLREDLHRWWAKARGRPDPLLKIGQEDHGNREGGELWALRDVSFQVQEGEILGIIGRNGAGKSTLLKILSRITAPTTGQVKIRGRVGSLLEVGTGFHPELTGRENIYLNGAILGMKKAEIDRKLDEIADFSGVEEFIDTPVKRYSSGMTVRLAFAVAAHLEPEIMIIDEVLAVGDAAFQKKCLGKMGEIANAGRTILFVSHNMRAITDLCPRALLINKGSVRKDGIATDIVRNYLNPTDIPTTHLRFEPKSTEAYFISLALCDHQGAYRSRFDVNSKVCLEIIFFVSKTMPTLQLAMSLFNSDGTQITYHSTGYCNPPLGVGVEGKHLVTARIPANFLPPGTYVVNIALHIPNVALYDRRERVGTFEIEEGGFKRYDFNSRSLGCVLANIEWSSPGDVT